MIIWHNVTAAHCCRCTTNRFPVTTKNLFRFAIPAEASRGFETSYQKRFSFKTISIILNLTLSPSYGTRRGKRKHPLSLGVVDTFSVFSRHHAKNVFGLKLYLLCGIRPYLLHMEPEGGKEKALYHWVLWTLLG